MVKPIFTAIMHDLSEYIHAKFPQEVFAVQMDNAKSHDLIEKLPYDNIKFINLPPNCTGYLQAADVLYNAVYKLKFNLRVEDFLLDQHFEGQTLGCNDENAARMASDVYKDVPKSIIKGQSTYLLIL